MNPGASKHVNKSTNRKIAALAVGAALTSLRSVARADSDPFANQGSGSAGSPSTQGNVKVAASVEVKVGIGNPACEHITAALCDKQNKTMLGLDAGYVVGCVFVAALVRAWFNKRATGSNAFRFLVPMLLAVSGAGALVGLDPARSSDLSCCLETPAFREHIFLPDSVVGRAVLFGVVPAAILYVIVVVVTRAIRR